MTMGRWFVIVKKNIQTRLLCILLSVVMMASGVQMPARASENTEFGEAVIETEAAAKEADTEEADGGNLEQPEATGATEEEEPEQGADQASEESGEEEPAPTGAVEDASDSDTLDSGASVSDVSASDEAWAEEPEDAAGFDTASEPEEISPEYSLFVVNPYYEELLDEDELRAETELLQEKALGEELSAFDSKESANAFQSAEAVAGYICGQMVERSNTVEVYLPSSMISSQEAFEKLVKELVEKAVAFTSACSGQEGDALAWGYKSYQASAASDPNSGQYRVTYTFTYYTTQEEERQLTVKVEEALKSLSLNTATEYQKIQQIYDYICDHVNYDYSYTKYSAYEALCSGTAVCQGYAVLFYRMCKDAGLSVRVITGLGYGGQSWENHAWNIAKLEQKYYNVDATWDGQDEETRHTYFLLNESDFGTGHKRGEAYSTTEFYQQYPMAPLSYAGENEGGSDTAKDNFDFEFTTLEGETISSKAEGRPKLLIFFSTNCQNSRSTVKNLADNMEALGIKEVDIYAIECNRGTKETVEAFRNTYAPGKDEILFSYDIYLGNSGCMWKYVDAYSGSGSVTFPVICYIDANNKFRYLTTGYSGASAIKNNLISYCGADSGVSERYTITYILDGGENSSANPAFYTSASDPIVLEAPVKEGYRFLGWYSDREYARKVTQIDRGSTGDRVLYAKWEKEEAEPKPEPEPSGPAEVDVTLTGDNVLMGFSGAYYTETAEKILARLNAIRLEACREGVIDPATGKALSKADYVPLQWSSDLEAIARLRAAEASVRQAHVRPNSQSCFSINTVRGEQSWAENLAWNYSGLMQGIEQWYEEKGDYVNNGNGQTGHYRSIISTRYRYVAVGAFRLSRGGWYSVAQEFSYKTSLDSAKDRSSGNCVQYIEVESSAVRALTFDASAVSNLEVGSSCQLPLNAKASYKDYYGETQSYNGPVKAGGRWRSSDEGVATVDAGGVVTAHREGSAEITVTVGSSSAVRRITVYEKGGNPFELKLPDKTTYVAGEKLDLRGAQIIDRATGEKTGVTQNMTGGFDSRKEGISEVSIVYKGYALSFDTLIVKVPGLSAAYGQTLSQVTLPGHEYGAWRWEDASQKLSEAGIHKYKLRFIPADQKKFQELTNLDAEVHVTVSLEKEKDLRVIFLKDSYVYNGIYQKPEVRVMIGEKILTRGKDYELSYENNKNAGQALLTVTGRGDYLGSADRTFLIAPAQLTVTAKDRNLLCHAPLPPRYEYTVTGLAEGEHLTKEPTFVCSIRNTAASGVYEILPGGAAADDNYDKNILYRKGILTVAGERVAYKVTFDLQRHGAVPGAAAVVRAGDTVTEPRKPSAEGYIFDGWYRDAAGATAWDFERDTVQADLTLYAGWLIAAPEKDLRVKEIADVPYNGRAQKPAFDVYDGDRLLKPNKDYKVSYYNNKDVNSVQKRGNGAGAYFNQALPYAEITGKGNYADDKVSVNFNIVPAVIGEDGEPAKGVTLRYTEQAAVNARKAVKPFSSIKCGKAMREGTDYTLALKALDAFDEKGLKLDSGRSLEETRIPAGYSGEYELTVTGIGNYSGTISRRIYVADKTKLMKNAKITLGKNIKSVNYTGEPIKLQPAYYDKTEKKYYLVKDGEVTSLEAAAADVFTVSCGNESLICQKDFELTYEKNIGTGKAVLTVTGLGFYQGKKTASFRITGEALKAGTVAVQPENQVYTGRAAIQNQIPVIYTGADGASRELVYGEDYTISYQKNINKGTAVMIFTAAEGSAYSGSFRKTFRIDAADLGNPSQVTQGAGMGRISAVYEKAGAQPADQIALTVSGGVRLKNGRDYTVSFRNHKAAANADGENGPVMLIKGKGNYKGTLTVPFTITRADLGREQIRKSVAAVAYNGTKSSDYEYRPAVRLTDGGKVLSVGTDYEAEYRNNTQADYEVYLQKFTGGKAAKQEMPSVVIRAKEGGNYTRTEPIVLPLPIYRNRLTKNNLHAVVDEAVYTGSQLTPAVRVYYSEDPAVTAKAAGLTEDSKIRALGLVRLQEGADYTLTYGANLASGKNKGSVKIEGAGMRYGGSVTVRFPIERKGLEW